MRNWMIVFAGFGLIAAFAQDPPGAVQGSVMAGDRNAPLAKTAILLRPMRGGTQAGPIIRGNTDEKGEFALTNLVPGRYMLSVEHAGYGGVTYSEGTETFRGTTFAVKSGETKVVRLRLSPMGSVTGSVVGPDGAALSGARVVLSHYKVVDGFRMLVPEREVAADANGAFVVTAVPSGDYFVTAYLRGEKMYGPAPSQAVKVELGRMAQGPKLQLAAARGYSVMGRVVDASGAPMAGVAVAARRDPVDGIPNLLGYDAGNAKTGASGEFMMAHLLPGRYRVDVTGGAQKVTGYAVVDVAQDMKGVAITAGPGAVVTGKVAIEGSFPGIKTPPSPRLVRVVLRRDLENGGSPVVLQRATATVADDGTFRMENVPEGPARFQVAMSTDGYYLKSIRQNGRDLTEQSLEVGKGGQVDGVEVVVSMNASQVSGRVAVQAGTAMPEVVVFPAGMESPRARERLTRVVRVNESGQFMVRGLPPGEYSVAAVRNAQEGSETNASFQSALQPLAKRVMLAGKAAAGVLEAVDAPR